MTYLSFVMCLLVPNYPNSVTLSRVVGDNTNLRVDIVPNPTGAFTKYRIQLQEPDQSGSWINSGDVIVKDVTAQSSYLVSVMPGYIYRVEVTTATADETESLGRAESNSVTVGKRILLSSVLHTHGYFEIVMINFILKFYPFTLTGHVYIITR